MADYEVIPAVAGQKNKASTYNTNFTRMKAYVDDSVEELTTETQNTLSLYQSVNTLATSGTIALETNTVNTITPQGNITFALPTITGEDATKFHQILVQVKLTDTTYLTADNNGLGTNYYFNGSKPRFTVAGNYEIIYSYDNTETKWCVGAIFKGTI